MNLNPKNYRLGNLLREAKTGQIVEIIGLKKKTGTRHSPHGLPPIQSEEFEVEVSGNFEDGWQAEEIPLTKDIFWELGFTNGNPDYYNVSFFIGMFGFWSDSKEKEWYWANCGTSLPINYVSELQNIYLDYFKKELDVSSLNPQPIP